MKIVVLDGYTVNPGDNDWLGLEECGEVKIFDRTSLGELFPRARFADILVLNKTPLDVEMIEKLPALRLVCVMATGYNVVDVDAARAAGVTVCNVPAYGTDTVAQYVMALLLELCHHVGEHAESVARGGWVAAPDWCYWKRPQVELRNLTIGIVGFGRIGQRVGELAHAFGMQVLCASRSAPKASAFPIESVSVEELFSRADVVSLHCSLSEGNTEFVNAGLLRRMKPNSFLINTARGRLINERDLAQALRNGVLAGAALDVLSEEPPASNNPLLDAPRCLITPHMAWASLAARRRIMETTVTNVKAFLEGCPQNVVNLRS